MTRRDLEIDRSRRDSLFASAQSVTFEMIECAKKRSFSSYLSKLLKVLGKFEMCLNSIYFEVKSLIKTESVKESRKFSAPTLQIQEMNSTCVRNLNKIKEIIGSDEINQ